MLTVLLSACTAKSPSLIFLDDDDGVAVSGEGEGWFEPTAVGFSYLGGWDEHADALTEWAYDGESYDGYVKVTLASAAFFSLAFDDPERDNEYCEIRAIYHSASDAIEARSEETGELVTLRAGFSGYLEIYGYVGGQCYNLDPEVWTDGEPYEVFDGMHFGLGFAPLTAYLAQAWSEDTVAQYGDYMFASYIAVNHPDGSGGYDFIAYDWTTSILWQWDTSSGEVLTDNEGVLVGQDFNDPVLSGWVSSYAYWYEDFPALDLSLLKEGVE